MPQNDNKLGALQTGVSVVQPTLPAIDVSAVHFHA